MTERKTKTDRAHFIAEAAAWQARRDRLEAKVDWQLTIDDARVKPNRFYPTFDA